MAYPFRGGLDHPSRRAKGRVLLSTRSTKRSRLRLTSPTVLSTSISGKGSRATRSTFAQGPQSTEIISPALLSLACQPPPAGQNLGASPARPGGGGAPPSTPLVSSPETPTALQPGPPPPPPPAA